MKRTPLRRTSKKRARQNKAYLERRTVFLTERPLCEICFGHRSRQIHHSAGRIGDLLLDEAYWLPVCALCHTWLHSNPSVARKMGYIKDLTHENK